MNQNGTRQTLGKYQLLERLGQGGMAQVYRARQPIIERDVAIKLLYAHLAASDNFVERFKREARSLGQLRHPNIVSVIDFDTVSQPGLQGAEASYFLVMDFIAGPTLAKLLVLRSRLPVEEALLIGEQIADALAYAHQQGVIHRDVKPGNIMFRDSGGRHSVLTDFGIVHLLADGSRQGLTTIGTLAGTPAYMSPEAATGGSIDQRSDLYSLGVVLYEMVTGATPYQGDTPVQMMMQHMTAPLPSLRQQQPDLPEMVIAIIERALAKTPDARFPNATALRQALLQARLAIHEGHAPQTQRLPAQTLIVGQAAMPHDSKTATVEPPSAGITPPADNRLPKATPLNPPAISSAAADSRPRRWIAMLAVIAIIAVVAVVGVRMTDFFSQTSAFFSEATRAATLAPSGPEVGRLQILPNPTGQDLIIAIRSLPPPPAGQQYHAWIVRQDGALFDLGTLTMQGETIQHHAAASQNVLGTIARVLITQEAVASPTAPSSQIVVRGDVAADISTALNHLFVTSTLPLGKALLPAAAEQITIAQEHVDLLVNGLAAGDLRLAQRHAEHLVNILEGETGEAFGDLNLDGQTQNPGDGVGVRLYLAETRTAFATLSLDLRPLDQAAASVADLIVAARQTSVADSLSEAQRAAAALPARIEQLQQGVDADGSGVMEWERGEGGFLSIQAAAAELRSFPLYRVGETK